MPKLTLDDLVAGLLQFADKYLALDVFITDVTDLQNGAPTGVTSKGDGSYDFERQGRTFNLRLFPAAGVARLMEIQSGSAAPAVVAGAAGAAAGAAISKRGEELGGAAIGMLVGLLVGAALGEPSPSAPRRVFAVRFDPVARRWVTYDGGLVSWMKERLAPPEILEALPSR